MLTQLAALGIGLVTLVGTPAIANADCVPTPSSSYPSHGTPHHHPTPTRAPVPTRRLETPHAVELRQADYDNDGGITFGEAQAYGRAQFRRADDNHDGRLTRREVHYRDELARGARGRDGVVTFAEYDANLRREFAELDRNRDGFLSRYELGRSPASTAVRYDWRWQL